MKISPNPQPFHYTLGDQGEVWAANHLRKKGYELLEKNYRSKLGEIDIIARKKGRLYFFEVKARKNSRFGRPEEAVNAKKQSRLVRLAISYLKEHSLSNCPAALGVIAITLEGPEGPDVRIFEHAFEHDYDPAETWQ